MLRVTIRELLLVTAFVAGSLASLKYAGPVAWMVIANGAAACLMIATVVALVDRGRRQAIASGCAACLAIYLAMLSHTATSARGNWATDMLLERLNAAMMTQTWIERGTGQEVAYDPQWKVVGLPLNVGGSQSPSHSHFMAVGHMLWALVFGYLGSRFAAWIYARRLHEQGSTPARTDP
jgi:hypothetical protein